MDNFDAVKNLIQGNNVIEASAGTGKTFNIQKIFLRLIVEKKLSIDRILVVTFTEAATAELREKIRAELVAALAYLTYPENKPDGVAKAIPDNFIVDGDKETDAYRRLLLAVLDFDLAAIYTIHGFCKRMLSDNSFESGLLFDTELVTDPSELITGIVNDFWRKHFYNQPPLAIAVADYKIDRKKLKKLADELIKPGITPDNKTENGPVEKLKELEQLLKEQLEKVKTIWTANKDGISAIIQQNVTREILNYYNFGNPTLNEHKLVLDRLATRNDGNVFNADIKTLIAFSKTGLADARTNNNIPVQYSDSNSVNSFFDACEEFRETLDTIVLDIKSSFYRYFKDELTKRKDAGNIQTFDDLLVKLRDALNANPALQQAIREKYRAVLIDEFQDTDDVQFEIFKTVFMDNNSSNDDRVLFFIGDPKQAIYSFRSADVFTYFKATKAVTNQNMLGVNFRTQEQLVADVNKLFNTEDKTIFNPFILDEMEYKEVKSAERSKGNLRKLMIDGKDAGALKLCWTREEKVIGIGESIKTICASVAGEITRLMKLSKEGKACFKSGEKEEKIKPSDFAILTRTNKEAAKIKVALEKCNIPAVLQYSCKVFDTDEALQMEIFMRAVATPGNSKLVAAALGSRIISIDATWLANTGKGDEAGKRIEEWSNRFQEYHHLWAAKSFMRMFRAFLNEKSLFTDGDNIYVRLLKYNDGERALTNLLHLAEVLHEAETTEKLGVNGLLNWLIEKRANTEGLPDDSFRVRLERDDEAVKIMTIHKSKGLEFPIVFCPFVSHIRCDINEEDFVYHDNDFKRFIHFNGVKEDERENLHKTWKEELAERMRLLYVAVTRAKNLTYIYGGNIRNSDYSALGYLLYAPADELESKNYIEGMKSISNSRKMQEDTVKRMENRINTHLPALKVDYPAVTTEKYSYEPEGIKIDARTFEGKIDTSWRMSSFSGLTRYNNNLQFSGNDKDDEDGNSLYAPTVQPTQSVNTFWTQIPKKTLAAELGTIVHEMFELIDFAADDNDIRGKIQPVLNKNNTLSNAKLLDPAVAMIRGVLEQTLPFIDVSFKLKDVVLAYRVSEMEFYYPLKDFSHKKVAKAFKDFATNELIKQQFPALLENNSFDIKGFMTGKLDLVFFYDDKYYILDWKTNKLGDELQDYSQENLTREMIKNRYVLQYSIYVKALDKLLRKELKDYNYNKQFGGVIYLFLRGLGGNVDGKPTGMFFDKPDQRILDAF